MNNDTEGTPDNNSQDKPSAPFPPPVNPDSQHNSVSNAAVAPHNAPPPLPHHADLPLASIFVWSLEGFLLSLAWLSYTLAIRQFFDSSNTAPLDLAVSACLVTTYSVTLLAHLSAAVFLPRRAEAMWRSSLNKGKSLQAILQPAQLHGAASTAQCVVVWLAFVAYVCMYLDACVLQVPSAGGGSCTLLFRSVPMPLILGGVVSGLAFVLLLTSTILAFISQPPVSTPAGAATTGGEEGGDDESNIVVPFLLASSSTVLHGYRLLHVVGGCGDATGLASSAIFDAVCLGILWLVAASHVVLKGGDRVLSMPWPRILHTTAGTVALLEVLLCIQYSTNFLSALGIPHLLWASKLPEGAWAHQFTAWIPLLFSTLAAALSVRSMLDVGEQGSLEQNTAQNGTSELKSLFRMPRVHAREWAPEWAQQGAQQGQAARGGYVTMHRRQHSRSSYPFEASPASASYAPSSAAALHGYSPVHSERASGSSSSHRRVSWDNSSSKDGKSWEGSSSKDGKSWEGSSKDGKSWEGSSSSGGREREAQGTSSSSAIFVSPEIRSSLAATRQRSGWVGTSFA